MDKSRQQFEKKFYNKFNFELTNKGNYRYFSTNIAWEAWKASRESLEVELPEPFIANETWCYDEDLVNQALISNGVKIKNES
ncbi:hypothetical protein AB7185_21270 [Providencia rettgeri]